MEAVLLKSRYGPTHFVHRPYGQPKMEFVFSMDNDCKATVPVDVWELLRDRWFDRTNSLRFKEAFLEL